MKKKIFLSVIMLLAFCLGPISSITALADIELNRESSLNITYKYGDTAYGAIPVSIYRIADIEGEYVFTPTHAFKGYPVKINGIKAQEEWKIAAETYASYIIADKIAPTVSAVTHANGTVSFEKLRPGLYLALGVSSLSEEGITDFEPFITVVPYLNTDGTYNYNPWVFPKASRFVPTDDDFKTLKVIKEWKDNGYAQKRPESIKVDIYRDGVFKSTVILSAKNNWLHTWTVPLDGAVWTTVEREIPEGYTVTVERNGDTVILTNFWEELKDTSKPGDITSRWLYIMLAVFTGMVLITLSIKMKRMSNTYD